VTIGYVAHMHTRSLQFMDGPINRLKHPSIHVLPKGNRRLPLKCSRSGLCSRCDGAVLLQNRLDCFALEVCCGCTHGSVRIVLNERACCFVCGVLAPGVIQSYYMSMSSTSNVDSAAFKEENRHTCERWHRYDHSFAQLARSRNQCPVQTTSTNERGVVE